MLKIRKISSVFLVLLILVGGISITPISVSAVNYNPSSAVDYARQYWNNYNPNYPNYNSSGGDCANFVSQCLYAGGIPQDSTWYSGSSAWISCTSQINYFKSKGYKVIDYAEASDIKVGNPVYYYNGNSMAHTAICVGYSSNGTPLVAAHNSNFWEAEWTLGGASWWGGSTRRVTILMPDPAPVHWYDNLTPVDLGMDFCALIFNKSINKPLTVEQNCNVAIKSEKSGWCVDQVWKFERQSDGSYKIVSNANRECLDVDNASNESGTNVKTCMDNGNNAQRWLIYENNSNYILKSKCTDCVLDVSNNNSSDGTNIQMCTFTNSSAQIFDICKIDNRDFAVNLGDNFLAKIVNTKSKILLENDKNGNVHLQNGDIGINQLWQFKRQSDGSYKIYSEFDGNCIDLCWANHENGTNIQVCSDYPNDAQCWYLYEYAGAYSIQSKESGKCFDIENGNLNYGANLQSYMWNWTDSQIFSIDKVDSTFQYLSKNIGDGFYALIKNKTSGKPIENNNSNVILGEENFSKNQVWFFERKTDNSYKISSLFDNKVIDLTNYGNTDGTNIQMCVSTDTTAQRWYIVENNGGYSFIPKCSQNGAMDLNGNSSAKGSNIQFWTFNGTDAQIFSIEKISDLDTYLKHIRECDINFDGTIDIKDIILMQRYLLGMISLSEQQLEYADYNNDGKFSLADIVAVQRYVMSL